MAFCGMPPLCHAPPGDQTDGTASSSPAPVPDGAGAAVVCTGVIWKSRQKLRVFVLNPEVLERWRLTIDTILEWANGNKDHKAWGDVMLFEETKKIDKADIRVKFSETEMSWSIIGMCATRVKVPEPTMVLNLVDKNLCYNDTARRSLVTHEFGHALGLGHEHQRVDFWETIEHLMDLDRMTDDGRVKEPISEFGRQTIGADWFVQKKLTLSRLFKRHPKLGTKELEYDPESIMHYGFDVMWLRDHRLHNIHYVEQCTELSEKEKKYVIGIHKRNSGLAVCASETDIDVLQQYYQ